MPSTIPSTRGILLAQAMLEELGEAGKYVWLLSKTMPLSERLPYLAEALDHLKYRSSFDDGWYSELPVDPRTFIESNLLLNMGDEVYPVVKEHIIDMCSGRYIETVLTGGIGSGKTTAALVATAYGLYELACMANPQRSYGLATSSEISLIFQSLNKDRARVVDFERFKNMLEASIFFETVFPWDKSRKSEMWFPNLIRVKPLSGDAKAAIGENIIGGVIDEINFMQVTASSKLSADGGEYDQARAIYSSISRRRESRFMIHGRMPGMLCLVSSKRYPGEFTDRKMEESKTNPRIKIYDKRVWEIKPEAVSGKWFSLFTGDVTEMPRVLTDEEAIDEIARRPNKIMSIPLEYKSSFDTDLLDAVRDIAGVSTLAAHPYMVHSDKVGACFDKVPSILSREVCNFKDLKLQMLTGLLENPEQPRFAHIDLALTSDSAGIAMGHVPRFEAMLRGTEAELLPVIRYDFLLEITPPKGGEIEFENIRRIMYRMRELGVNLKWISFDSFQSRDSIQILKSKGFNVGLTSLDTSPIGYDVLKQALYDGRVEAPKHTRCLTELLRLEQNEKTGKIDHPADFSKDVADAMAGVAYGLTFRREIWTKHGIPLGQVPASIKALLDKKKIETLAKNAGPINIKL